MDLKVNDRVCFIAQDIISAGTILKAEENACCVYDEIEKMTYDNIDKDRIIVKECEVDLIEIFHIRERAFGLFELNNQHYHKIIAPELTSYFACGIPDDKALCLKAWATGTIITPFMMQEFINLDTPDGPLIGNPQYDSFLATLLTQKSTNQELVNLDDETCNMLTLCCRQVGLLPRDYLMYCMEKIIDEKYQYPKEHNEEFQERIVETYIQI